LGLLVAEFGDGGVQDRMGPQPLGVTLVREPEAVDDYSESTAMARIHILGASGTGTTTLGAALADSLGCIHADADTFYWLPTDPPFTTPRPREARLALLLSRIKKATSWVFSGSAISWAMPLERLYDLVVFLRLDPVLRMERLRRREIADYGARIEPGGDMELASRQFFEWAAAYDSASLEQVRSLATHELWLSKQRCPVQRLDAAAPVKDLVGAVLAKLRV
jgi:adenylate kinase family enzyme